MKIMPSCGWDSRSLGLDCAVQLTGSSNYSTDVVAGSPGNNPRSLAVQGNLWVPWVEGSPATATPLEPTNPVMWMGWHSKPTGNNIQNENFGCGLGRNATEIAVMSRQNSTGLVTLRVAGSVVATSAYPIGVLDWKRLMMRFDNQVGGSIKVYMDGDLSAPIIDHALASALSIPNGYYVRGAATPIHYIDHLWAVEVEPGDSANIGKTFASWLIQGAIRPVGAGPSAEWGDGIGGPGLYTAIDDLPPNDTTSIESTSPDEVSTFEWEPLDLPLCYQVMFRGRVTRTGVDAGERLQIQLVQGATTLDIPASPMAAPGDGHDFVRTSVDANGDPLTPALWASGFAGPVSRT